jgi:hypothetical protein
MWRICVLFLGAGPLWVSAQTHPLLSQLKITEAVPPKLLAAKSVVLYAPSYNPKELQQMQQAFQQIGIDAVSYYPADWVLANTDVAAAFAAAWNERGIALMVLAEKEGTRYQLYFTPYNGKKTLIDKDQAAWGVGHEVLNELLLDVYRDAWAKQKKENLLINSFPETGALPEFIEGRRMELYALDLKVDYLAVPLTNDSTINQQLREFFQQQYPFRYKFVRLSENERDLRRQGFHFILKQMYGRGEALRQVLQYDMTKKEKSYASTTYPNGLSQIKMIPPERPVFKFYFKQIESGHVYLGARWDADEELLPALRNHIKALKAELKIE